MSSPSDTLSGFLDDNAAVIRVVLTRVRGSSPREEGAEMFVSASAIRGTVGGGRLEYRAIEAARCMLRDGALSRTLDLPLGPEIGQCCGGRVEITLARMRVSDKRGALVRAAQSARNVPHVYVLGAGHLGRALAELFQYMPVRCIVVDPRADEIALCSAIVETRVSAIPEADVRSAPPGSAFIVATHDHGLDFLLTAAALERGDAAYVGMIGSATKRIKLRKWMRQHSDLHAFEQLVCPIGAGGSRDKRPSLIAAFVVAEVMAELTSETAATAPSRAPQRPVTGHQPDRLDKRA